MIRINEFKDYHFKITWRLLYLGFRGSYLYADQLLAKDIINYAIERLEDEKCNNLICDLASEYESNIDDIHMLLKKIVDKEPSNEIIELKKLRVVLLLKS
jgi:hypothetical protein